MPIQLKLFGDLRKKAQDQISGTSSLRLKIDDTGFKKVLDIMKVFSIKEEEVSHIFVNGSYAGFKKNIKNGDIVALFPKNMGVLYKWYFNRDEDE